MKILLLTLLLPWFVQGAETIPFSVRDGGLRGMAWLVLSEDEDQNENMDVLRIQLAKSGIPLAGEPGSGYSGLLTLNSQKLPGGVLVGLEVHALCKTVYGTECMATVWASNWRWYEATTAKGVEASIKAALREDLATEIAAAWVKANPPKAAKIQTLRE